MGDSFLPSSPLDWALRYIKLGWAVFPLAGKKPLIKEWQVHASLDEGQVRTWWTQWPEANIAIRTGDRFFMFDVDVKSGGEADLDFLREQYGPFPATIQQVTGTGGYHFLFEMPDFPVRNLQGIQSPIFGKGIDVRGVGGFMVAAPSLHPDNGREYFWDGMQEIEDQKIAPAPKWMLEKLRARLSAPDPAKGSAPPIAERVHKGEGRHNVLVSIAGSMRRRGLSGVEMFPALMAVNQARCDPPYDEKHVRQIALSMEKYPAGKPYLPRVRSQGPPFAPEEVQITVDDVEAGIDDAIARKDLVGAIRLAPGVGTLRPMMLAVIIAKLRKAFGRDFSSRLFIEALKDGSGERSPAEPQRGDDYEADGAPGPDLRMQPRTDAGNGERIAALFSADIRFCIEMRRWLVWDGRRWRVDEMNVIRQKAKTMARTLYLQATGDPALEKHARASESYQAITAALGQAATEKGIPISVADLDQQSHLLNCLNGVVDLRTGTLLPHNREFLLTKLCPVAYDSEAQCPRFIEFITWTMGANPEAELTERTARLVGFLQRAFGYALTSDVSEKAVFILHGERGNNGKTTLLELFRDVVGPDYSGQLVIDTVMTMKNQDATSRADLADLRGVRYVLTSEVEKEHRLNEGKIKYITAGMGSIKAAKKYENPIEFKATHKLFMDCNHRPVVRGVDDAIWRRLKLVPFNVTISEDAKDLSLPVKLRAELPGVLAWAVRGCLAWQRDGLGDPPEVADAGTHWREHDDPLKDFLDDCTEIEAGLFVKATDLTGAYEVWARQNRERYPLGREAFLERLQAKGFRQSRSRRFDGRQARTWEGIGLNQEARLTVGRAPSLLAMAAED